MMWNKFRPRLYLLYSIVPKESRTAVPSVSEEVLRLGESLLTQECLKTYVADYHLVNFNYSKYSGDYRSIASPTPIEDLPELCYECDLDDGDENQIDSAMICSSSEKLLKEGYVTKGSDANPDNFISFKGTKRRFCCLRQGGDGSFRLDFYKDKSGRGGLKGSIYLESTMEISKTLKRGKFQLDLHTGGGGNSPTSSQSSIDRRLGANLTFDSDDDCQAWLSVLSGSLERLQMAAKKAKLEETISAGSGHSVEVNSTKDFVDSTSISPADILKLSNETDQTAALMRQKGRFNLFALYPDIQANLTSSDQCDSADADQIPSEVQMSSRNVKFLVECRSLSIKLPVANEDSPAQVPHTTQVEPFFLSLTLFDAQAGKRLSEVFSCDLNPTELKSEFLHLNAQLERKYSAGADIRGVDESWLWMPTRKAIFSVSNPHADVFLLIRVEKILQGGIAAAQEFYTKPDAKSTAKLTKTLRQSGDKLGRYRMPFAWAAKPVFQQLIGSNADSTGDSLTLYRSEAQKLSDEDVVKLISDLKRSDKSGGKIQPLPGCTVTIKLDLTIKTETLQNVVSSSYLPIRPFESPPVSSPVVEIDNFTVESATEALPYSSYENRLYVYPLALKFDSQRHFSKARNLLCSIQLRNNDQPDSPGLTLLYGQRGIDPHVFVDCVTTAVCHHETSPQFYQEVKIQLPPHLTDKHHLLFSFKHVSVESAISGKKLSTREAIESQVGFAWLPLLKLQKLNMADCHNLPVAANLPAGYLGCEPLGMGRGFSNSDVKWIDGAKPLFKVNLTLRSTVFSKDIHLQNFFSYCQRMFDAKTAGDIGSPERIKKSSVTSANNIGAINSGGETADSQQAELVKLIKTLHAVDTVSLIHFLPTIFNQLLSLLPISDSEEVQLNTIRTLVHIVNEAEAAKKHSILETYVKCVFVPSKETVRSVHEELLKSLTILLRPGKVDSLIAAKFLRNCWFFTRIIIKSMAMRLLTSGRIKMSRTERFSSDFQFRVETFVHTAVAYICQKYAELSEEVQLANRSIAEFIKVCLSLMNRGFVFQLIHFYIDKLDSLQSKLLVQLKLDFITIVSCHEHLVPMSLPLKCCKAGRKPTDKASSQLQLVSPTTESAPNNSVDSGGIWQRLRTIGGFLFSENQQSTNEQFNARRPETMETSLELWLSEDYCRHHYPTGVILQLISWSLTEPTDLRHKAILLLRNLLAKQTFDARYDGKQRQSRLAALYFPLISVALEHLDLLQKSPNVTPIKSVRKSPAKEDWKRSTLGYSPSPPYNSLNAKMLPSGSRLTVDTTAAHSDFKLIDSHSPGAKNGLDDTNYAKRAEKSASLSQIGPIDPTPVPFLQPPNLGSEEAKDLLISILSILKSVGEEILLPWWKQCGEQTIDKFLNLLEICLEKFCYKGKRKILRDYLHGNISDKQSGTDSPVPSCKGTFDRQMTIRLEPFDLLNDPELFLYTSLEANLSNEVGLVILDILALFTQRSAEQLGISRRERPVFDRVVNLFLAFLTPIHSEPLLLATFASLRSFIKTYSRVIFGGSSTYCASLCQQLLKCCNSALESIQTGATAVLYLLMKENFYASGQRNFTKVHLQIIMSLSQLLGDVVCLNSPQFHRSLAILSSFVTADRSMINTAFEQEVKEVVRKLRTVLSATALLSEHADDPEMLADLQLSLANSYAGSCELRRTWLESLARLHIRQGNISEAAGCQLHIAALIAEVLKRKGVFRHGVDLFQPISANIGVDEGNMREDGGLRDVQYSDEIFIERVEQAADLLVLSQRFELLGILYRLIEPIYEEKRNFEALARVYKRLYDSNVDVIELNRSGKRRLGSYFKVSFYGQAVFEDQSGREYVYKEPNVTSLAEISSRLASLYSNKFGSDAIRLISHSNPVNLDSLDPKLGFIQVVHVTPHFEPSESHRRQTEFDRNSNLRQFVFETPFTGDSDEGKCHAATVDQQWKRKTFVTTAYSFPYVVKRIPVESKRHVELDPLDVAIEEMSLKTKELMELIDAETTDLIRLQLRLQGSVQTTVNAGPICYAETFTDERQIDRFGADRLNSLKEIFRQFLSVCSDGLALNAVLISSDQTEYHQSLVENFRLLVDRIGQIFHEEMLTDSNVGGNRRSSAQVFNVISSGTTAHSSSNA